MNVLLTMTTHIKKHDLMFFVILFSKQSDKSLLLFC